MADDKNKQLLMSLIYNFQMQTMIQLGKLANPMTQKIERHLEGAQFTIDLLDMLKSKTKGNLEDNETRFIDQIIADLKLNFVEEMTKEKQAPKSETKTEPVAEIKSDDKTENEAAEKNEDNSQEKTEEKSQEKTEDKSKELTEDKSKEKTEEKSKDKTDVKSNSKPGKKSDSQKNDKSKK